MRLSDAAFAVVALGIGLNVSACFSPDITVVAGGLACTDDDECPSGLECNQLLRRCGQVGVVELSQATLTPGTHSLGALLVAEVELSDVPSSTPTVTFADDRGGVIAMALDDVQGLNGDDRAGHTFVFRHTVNGAEGDGEHPVTLSTADEADGVLIGTWRIDTVAPALVTDSIVVDEEAETIALELRFDADVADADVALVGSDAAFAVTFGNAGLVATAQVAPGDLDGAYDFDVVVSDDAGNETVLALAYDSEAPILRLLGVAEVVSTAPGHDRLDFDLVVESPGDAQREPVDVRFTAGVDVPCALTLDTAPRTYRCGRVITDADSEGERIVIATVTDAFGNVGEVRENVVVDRTAPDLIDDQLLISGNRRELTLELRFDEPIASATVELVGNAAAATFAVDVGGGAVSGVVTLAAEDAVGAYDINVIAADRAGNTLQRTLSFDQEAPELAIANFPVLVSSVDGHNILSATVTVTSPGSPSDERPLARFTGGQDVACTLTTTLATTSTYACSRPITLDDEEGVQALVVSVVDAFGNEAQDSVDVRVDHSAPSLVVANAIITPPAGSRVAQVSRAAPGARIVVVLLADEALGEDMAVTLSSPAFVEDERTQSPSSLQVVYVTTDLALGGDVVVDVDVDVVDVVGNRAQRRVLFPAGDLIYDDLAVVPNIDDGLRLQRAPDLGDNSAVDIDDGAVAEPGRLIVVGSDGEDAGHLDLRPGQTGSIVLQGDRTRPQVIFVDSAGNETPTLPLTRATLLTSIAENPGGAYLGAFDQLIGPAFEAPNRVADVGDTVVNVGEGGSGAFAFRAMANADDDISVQGGSHDTFLNREVFARQAGGSFGPPTVQVVTLGEDGLRVLAEQFPQTTPASVGRIVYDPRRRSVVGFIEFFAFSCNTGTTAFQVFETTGPSAGYGAVRPGAQRNAALLADSDSGLIIGGGSTRNFGDVGQCQNGTAPRLRFDGDTTFQPHLGSIAVGVVNPATGRTVSLQSNGTVEVRDGVDVVIDPTVTAQSGAQLFVDLATEAVLMAGYRADNSPVARVLQGGTWAELGGLPAITSRPAMRATRRILRRQSSLQVGDDFFMFDGTAMVPLVLNAPAFPLHQPSGVVVLGDKPAIVGVPGGAVLVEARTAPSFAHVFVDGAFVLLEMPVELETRTAVALAYREAGAGDDEVLAFGGFDDTIVRNDVWALSLTTRTWRQLTVGDTFDTETGQVVPADVLTPPATTSLVFVQAPDGSMLARSFNETWRFNGDDTWTLLDAANDALPPGLQDVALVTTRADVFLLFRVGGVLGAARFDDDAEAWAIVNLDSDGDGEGDIVDVVGGVVGDPLSAVVRFAGRDADGALRSVALDAGGVRLGGLTEALPDDTVVDMSSGDGLAFVFRDPSPQAAESVTIVDFPRGTGSLGVFLPLTDPAIPHRGAVEAVRIAVLADGDATADVWSSTSAFEPLGDADGEAAVSDAVARSVYDHGGAYVRVAGDADIVDGRLEVDYVIE